MAHKSLQQNLSRAQHNHQAGSAIDDALSQTILLQAPVLAGTLLCLELLLTQQPLDLGAISTLIRRDPGAVLHLYALIAEECPECAERPERLEDCIASVGLQELARRLRAASAAPADQARLVAFAQHACLIACYAEVVAASLGVYEGSAYLVGLLHAIGTLMAATEPFPPISQITAAEDLAAAWCIQYSLPAALCHAIDDIHHYRSESVWTVVVAAAHDLAASATRRS